MRNGLVVLAAAALLLGGCEKVVKKLPDLPEVDLSLFPKSGGDQNRLLADVSAARIEIDPTMSDAITAVGACVDQVVSCYQPGSAPLADCLERARVCETKEPWNEATCCPQPCKDDFTKAVEKGATEADAFDTVFFADGTCFPGLRAALEVTP